MILDGDAAYLGQALVDLQIAAIGREASETDRRRVVDQLQGRLLRKQHHGRRYDHRTAIGFIRQRTPPKQ
ncbi:MAG: hypothetical protein WCE28_15990 [Bradyrhizobium sp.]|jgi:hypothetical protein